MKKSIIILNIFFILFIKNILAQNIEIVAYYFGDQSQNKIPGVKFIKDQNIADKITVINYSFAVPIQDSFGNIIPQISNSESAYQQIFSSEMSVDGVADNPNQKLRGHFNQLLKLKTMYPHLKIMIAIGGWGGSKYFSNLALTHNSREKFVDASIDMFIRGNLPELNNAGGKEAALGLFDGIDLDWEFPISGGAEGTNYHPTDRENHTELFKLFREKLDEIDSNLLLTAAVSGRSYEFWKYNFNEDQKYLNWFNLMSYDLHGSWENVTGHHTNLLSSDLDVDRGKESFERGVRYLIDSVGVSPNKIVPGAAYYGKGWSDVDSANNGLYQYGIPLKGWGFISFKNFLDFSEVTEKGFKYSWDDNALAPSLYSSKEKIFWTYDDIRSVALKSRYVDAFNLRGLMFWQILSDDTLATLTKTIYNKNMPDVKFEENKNEVIYPTINIISPKQNDKYFENENIIIYTNYNDEDGKVIKVEFFVNEESIGYNTVEPFNWAWFNASIGDHQINCVAYDNNGNKTISAPIKISIMGK
jgi:chitinase